jgi:hypothetical protein
MLCICWLIQTYNKMHGTQNIKLANKCDHCSTDIREMVIRESQRRVKQEVQYKLTFICIVRCDIILVISTINNSMLNL